MKQTFFFLLTAAVLVASPVRSEADEEVTCRNLQIYYDTARLEEELLLVANDYMPRQIDRENWMAIPLRNAAGTNTRDGVELYRALKKGRMLPCKNNEFLEKLPYISSIIEDIAERFAAEVGLVRLSKVPSQKVIARHSDGLPFDFHNGTIYRLHIPILTGNDVLFEIGGKNLHLLPGYLYYTNVVKPHAVYNNGLLDRVHLVIDVHANPYLHTLILSSPEVPTNDQKE